MHVHSQVEVPEMTKGHDKHVGMSAPTSDRTQPAEILL
jgi:hypothetical protein